MTPTELLKYEHQIILKVLDATEREIKATSSNKINTENFEKIIDFIRNFADKCHHAKEEKQLFVKMQERGMSAQSGPIAVMLMEHEQGRKWVQESAEALQKAKDGNIDSIELIKSNLSNFIDMLRAHISKEDNILYRMGDNILTREDQEYLSEVFDEIESKEMESGNHKKYYDFANELSNQPFNH